jgi:formate dehydrogenase major subunit
VFDPAPIGHRLPEPGRELTDLTRRGFLKVGAAGAAAAGASTLGFETAVAEARTIQQELRIQGAKVSHSVCPYCAVGCSLLAYTRGKGKRTELIQIEGDPDSPVNEGTLCPKGASSMELAVSARRLKHPLYRAPGAKDWKRVSWEFTLDRLARRIKDSRDNTFVTKDDDGNVVNRTEGIAFAGGAAFSNEEGYLAAKLMRGLGVIYIEQQARV